MGKTSILNYIERHIEVFEKEKDKSYIKFHYNPWLYQSKEEMLFDFFETLSKKVIGEPDEKLKKAGAIIKKYSRYLQAVKLSASGGIPKVFNAGITIEPSKILQTLGEDLEGEPKSLMELKDDIDKSLVDSNKKILIFIDDIDRLDKDEIFTLFKIIKVNANFKNLIFVVCMDINHVSNAIYGRYGNRKEDGEEFIEKIINIPLELPLIENYDLDNFLKTKTLKILENKIIKDIDKKELLDSIDGKYFNSPREIIRVLNSFSISLFAIGDEVNIHDLFWIECLKIKYREAYTIIKAHVTDYLTNQFLSLQPIDLNNLFNNTGLISGTREKLTEKHKKSLPIVNKIFPFEEKKKLQVLPGYKHKNIDTLESELRISHVKHIEKYFSFHAKNKISEIKFNIFKQKIKDYELDEAEIILKEIISEAKIKKVAYKIHGEIDTVHVSHFKNLIGFLIQKKELFIHKENYTVFSNDIFEKLGLRLKKNSHDPNNLEQNKDLCFHILDNTDIIHFIYFYHQFTYDNDLDYLENLNKKIIIKLKAQNNLSDLYSKSSFVSSILFDIWKNVNPTQLKIEIINSLDSKKSIEDFLSIFIFFWNNSIRGIFKRGDYIRIQKGLKLDTDLILKKIHELYPETKDLESIDTDSKNWNDKVNNSKLNTIKQFVYWHFKFKDEITD